MKKIYSAFVMLVIVFFVSGCTSMILNAYKRIEPMSFEVKPPTKNEFVILIPDEQVTKTIIGTWVCRSQCNSYSKLDINGKPFMYTNMPVQNTENIWSFTSDGKCHFRIKSSSINPQTGKVSNTETQQKGSWKCENGVLKLSLYSEPLRKNMTMTAVAVWSDPDTMEFRYDGDSYQRMIEQALASTPQQPGVVNKSKFYYDDDGNFYVTMSISGRKNRMIFMNNIITKQPRQIFKKLK